MPRETIPAAAFADPTVRLRLSELIAIPVLLAVMAGPAGLVGECAAQGFRSGVTVSPREGPPGSVVRVYGRDLPPSTPVFVSVARWPMGIHDELDRTYTDQYGATFAEVRVPRDAREGDDLVFAITTIDLGYTRMSPLFHVTAAVVDTLAEGSVVVARGLLVDRGAECLELKVDGASGFWLAGDEGRVPAGTRARVRGIVSTDTFCGEGLTLAVLQITPDDLQPIPEDPMQEDMLTVQGVITDEGIECLALRGDDGTLYTLVGPLPDLVPGDRVRVHGRRAEMSVCMQGVTIEVAGVEVVGGK
jgi:hypothetical protein